jgi:hypothetical protein
MPSLVLLRFPPLGETDGTQIYLVTFLGGAFDSDGGGNIDGACSRGGFGIGKGGCGGLVGGGRFGKRCRRQEAGGFERTTESG